MGHQHLTRNILLYHYVKESGEKRNTGDSLHQANIGDSLHQTRYNSIDLFLWTKHGESKHGESSFNVPWEVDKNIQCVTHT